MELELISYYPTGGVYSPCGAVSTREICFLSRLVKVLDMWNDLWTGDGTLSSRGRAGSTYESYCSQSEIDRWGWDFHTVRRGINPDDIRVRPRVVAVVDVCVDGFRSRHLTLSCPGDAYFVYEPQPMSDQTKTACFYFRL